MTETFTDASTDVETEEPPAPETKTPSVAASDTETAEPSDSEAETPPAETSDPETEEPPAETPGTETEEPPVDEPTETPPAETPAVQPEYRVQVDTVEGYHNQPVALTIRLEDVGGTGWTKLEASTEQNAPEKRTDLTEALQKTALLLTPYLPMVRCISLSPIRQGPNTKRPTRWISLIMTRLRWKPGFTTRR